MRRLVAAAACLLAATVAHAQVYRFKTYTSNTGLPSNAIYGIFQDSRGYVWFSTDGGVSRYDGVHFTNFSVAQGLVDASVRGVIEDGQGLVWIMTKGGLSRYDGTRFENLTTAQGLIHNEVRCGLRTRDGALWFGTTLGLSRYDGAGFRSVGAAEGLPTGPVWALLEDSAGILWVGTRGGGLARFEGGRFKVYGKPEGLPDANVFGLAEDPRGGLWIATDGGLVRFDGTRFREYTTADGLPSNRVSSILVDRHGRVWCGTFGGGISRMEAGRFSVFSRRNGLPDDYITALYKDYEENIWIGGMWAGAFRFVSEQFTNYTAASGLGEGMVSGIAEAPDGGLWLSSINTGLSRLDAAGAVRRFGAKEGLPDEHVFTLFIDSRGRVWVGGLSGASWYDGARFGHFSLAEMGARERINAIIEDRQGRMWFGSGAASSTGVVVYDGRSFTVYSSVHGLAHNQVNSFALGRSGTLWVCTEDGLSRFDGGRFTNFQREHGLPSKRAIVAHEDETGALWVGTADGLARFDGRAFRSYRTEDGLVNNYIHSLTGGDGQLWIGTSRGISAFDGTRFRSYTVKDGMIAHEISTGTAVRRRDGSVWFGTPSGAVRYQSVKEAAVAHPPRVYVTTARARDSLLALAPSLSLDHDQNSLAFEFLALSFADEEDIRYSYVMQGLDPDWSLPGDARSVRFTNLEPGAYRFLVKARSHGGLWSEPAGIAFQIRPPLWSTWWFRLLALAAASGLVYAGSAWRIRILEERHRQRIATLRQLLESIRVINSGLDLATVLQNIAAESAHLVDGQPGGIGLVRESRVLFERVWVGDRWEHTDFSLPLGEGVAGRVAATGQAMVVNDVLTHPQLAEPENFERYGAVGLIDVPIIDRTGRVVGVLDVRRPPGRAPFGESERQLLDALSHQAAVAIENAGLYGALEERKVTITESLWAIEELYKNEKEMTRMLEELNRMKTNFMIVTSHEMRTPLTLLKGYHEALLEGYLGALTAAQQQCLGQGHRTVDRMIASFNDILEMLQIDERSGVLERSPQDVAEVAREVLADLATFIERRKQRVVLDAPPALPKVMGDGAKLRLVLLNLVENAIKFTPDAGEIRVRLVADAAGLHVTVEDGGIGIESWELDRIFDRFYTGPDSLHHSSGTYQFKSRGSGLGLAIAKGHVEAHGGRIWAESGGPGRGSTFHVVLPTAAAETRESAATLAAG